MAAEEALFNATILLIPLWLGVAWYLISEIEFRTTGIANAVGLGMVLVLVGILFPMWVGIEQIMIQSEELSTGLFVLFATVGLTGIGGILFIIREIDHISGRVVTGIPVVIIVTGVGVVFLPLFISQLSASSIRFFLQ